MLLWLHNVVSFCKALQQTALRMHIGMKVLNIILAGISGVLANDGNLTDDKCQIKTVGFCLPKDYNKYQRPKHNETLNVQVKMRVEQVTDVDDVNFKISLLMYMSLYWEEPSLKYIGPNKSSKPEDLPLNLEWANKLWLPDVFVYKMESVKQPEILQKFGSMR